MRLILGVLIIALIGSTAAAIKCVAGSNAKYDRKSFSVCTSLSFCVTLKHKSGAHSFSCDGNSFSHPSLCSLYKPRSPANDYFYGSQIGSSSTSSRQSRLAVTDSGQSCYNAGELGDVCCCNSDFCNHGSKPLTTLVLLVSLFVYHIVQ